MRDDEQTQWLTNLVEHARFPMGLRIRPNADNAANRKRFTRRLVITHQLEHVRPNGLPESCYNLSLATFDRDVHRLVEGEGNGLVVVETFVGKRTYYCYVDPTATFKSRYGRLTSDYPQHVLEVAFNEEGDWETYALYRKLFPW